MKEILIIKKTFLLLMTTYLFNSMTQKLNYKIHVIKPKKPFLYYKLWLTLIN